MKKVIFLFFCILSTYGCSSPTKNSSAHKIAFVDAFEDATLAQAKQGFFDALKKHGFEDKKNLEIIYSNAQNSIPTLIQGINYAISQKVELIATNATLPTITAAQREKTIPIFMMVSSSPKMAGLEDAQGNAPSNLYGIYENLNYIDTSVAMIKTLRPAVKRLGAIYNQSEPQSVDAYNRIVAQAKSSGMELIALPVNSSADTKLVVESLLAKKIDAFFALPDNTVFASFETIVKSCDKAEVPVFTSEAGLVKRGAVAAFGADLYQWGFQAGEQAAAFLKDPNDKSLKPEVVEVRKRVFNPQVAAKFGIKPPADFEIVK
ncbi:ABC transporter substrate-binding protein [Solitalea koreensis]|uniref:Putative ABC transport system substrate-binding protein n=1 Tax=Solitalea koreensis TaxID=543615 RepID=A0A521BCS1_9SPHI|nr:ABC transporter substrate-binding protein [Solitalea koreensis]SMO44882.1 putative ABC transport system substrate-binding protein [Solitalea koreensis]